MVVPTVYENKYPGLENRLALWRKSARKHSDSARKEAKVAVVWC